MPPTSSAPCDRRAQPCGVEVDSLVASNASRIAPDLKAAIRENKPQIITALVGSGCKVTIIEIPATGLRYRQTFARLQLKPPALVEVERALETVCDGRLEVFGAMGRAGRNTWLDPPRPVRLTRRPRQATSVLSTTLAIRPDQLVLAASGPPGRGVDRDHGVNPKSQDRHHHDISLASTNKSLA
jgi:hypothetical protein